MTPGCTILGILRAAPGQRNELAEILRGFVEPTRGEPGCVDYDLHVSDDDPNLFMFYENWRSRNDLDDHLAMPYLAVLRERADELLAADVEIQSYTMLSPHRRAGDESPQP